MRNKSLKSVLKFWQEIVLAVPIGLLLIEITKNRILQRTMDGADIFMVLWFLPLLVCLLGQFFWKKEAVAEVLSVFLGVSAVIVILMALWGSPSYRMESITMLVIGVISVIAVITMPRKYNPNSNACTLVKQ
ncbi:MAG: hypothetical protein FWC10_10960 [Lentimicrobiaceae bacterium]|nr:hypothetical protein [Lentimicrobiaceae bacterium]